MVSNGETEKLKESLDIRIDQANFHERVGKDSRKEREYMAVSLINTFLIAAIKGGVYPPEANWIADEALSRLFRSVCRKSIHEYLMDERISAAEQLLREGKMSLSEIAALLQFCDQSHFVAAFRRKTGMTPGKYRSLHSVY